MKTWKLRWNPWVLVKIALTAFVSLVGVAVASTLPKEVMDLVAFGIIWLAATVFAAVACYYGNNVVE